MKTLETDAEIGEDGGLKLLSPLPAWLKPGKAHVLLVVDEQTEDRVIPKAGSLKGFRMSPDFDEPLEDFKDYIG